jgi:hypothetical protein
MMVMSPLNEETFDIVQVQLGYCKLFQHILKDFVTRADMIQILAPGNIPVMSNAIIPVAGSAGPAPVIATATGPVNGVNTKVIYDGSVPAPASTAMISEKESIRRSGGTSIKAMQNLG